MTTASLELPASAVTQPAVLTADEQVNSSKREIHFVRSRKSHFEPADQQSVFRTRETDFGMEGLFSRWLQRILAGGFADSFW